VKNKTLPAGTKRHCHKEIKKYEPSSRKRQRRVGVVGARRAWVRGIGKQTGRLSLRWRETVAVSGNISNCLHAELGIYCG